MAFKLLDFKASSSALSFLDEFIYHSSRSIVLLRAASFAVGGGTFFGVDLSISLKVFTPMASIVFIFIFAFLNLDNELLFTTAVNDNLGKLLMSCRKS